MSTSHLELSMHISKHDYLIIRDQKRYVLARALGDVKSSKADVDCVWEKLCHMSSQRTVFSAPQKDVVLNLGSNPAPGKVYGHDVSALYYTKKAHDEFGDIHFFYKPEKEVVKNLWAALDKVAKILTKHKLQFLLEDVVFEVMPFNGEKYAGMFIKSKGDKILSRIQIKPEALPATEYGYVLLHELGHRLHLDFIKSKKINATWLKLFNTSIRVATVKKEVSAAILEDLLGQEDLPSDFKGQLGEDDALAFKWIVRTIQSVNALSIKDMDTLFEADMKDEIRKLWPVRTIPRKELEPVVSEYATKNYKELVAESFAFHLIGKKLPEPIVRLVEKTISLAKVKQE